jgi:cytochrome c oxidase assembly protein subunit 20
MAGDTRESPPQAPRSPPVGETEPPRDGRTPPNYEVFHSPPASANALPPGSGQNTAGAKPNVSLVEAIKTVRLQDFSQVHMYPCVRESLLMGIGAGFGIGGVRKVLGGEPSPPRRFAVRVGL